MSNVPEGYGGADTLAEIVVSLSDDDLSTGDIAHCKRFGDNKSGSNRLILVVLKRED